MGNGDEEIHVGNPVWGTGNASPPGPIHRRWARYIGPYGDP